MFSVEQKAPGRIWVARRGGFVRHAANPIEAEKVRHGNSRTVGLNALAYSAAARASG